MDYENGNLCKKKKSKIQQNKKNEIDLQILKGSKYLPEKMIIYSDLRSANILFVGK
jgi:serine/threonine protein kinase